MVSAAPAKQSAPHLVPNLDVNWQLLVVLQLRLQVPLLLLPLKVLYLALDVAQHRLHVQGGIGRFVHQPVGDSLMDAVLLAAAQRCCAAQRCDVQRQATQACSKCITAAGSSASVSMQLCTVQHEP